MELIVIWLLFGIIGGLIGSKKDAGCLGFTVGILLGPIGIIIALVMKGNQRKCPACKKLIDPKATICPYCHSDVQKLFKQNDPNEQTQCPKCKKFNRPEDELCGHCGSALIKSEGI
jgi:RNA polymerase subunit RPABC4/transcription elongation factor Spt4